MPANIDSCFLLKSKKIAIVKEKKANNAYLCDVINRAYVDTFFDSPLDSNYLILVFSEKIKGITKGCW
jgi:hypothetical protein